MLKLELENVSKIYRTTEVETRAPARQCVL